MINTKFEAYKLKRELLRAGKTFEFKRNGLNEFGENLLDVVNVGGLLGLYHEQNSYISTTDSEATRTRTEKTPMILCLYEDVNKLNLKVDDFIILNNKKLVLKGIVDIQEWNIICDISLEVVDDGYKFS